LVAVAAAAEQIKVVQVVVEQVVLRFVGYLHLPLVLRLQLQLDLLAQAEQHLAYLIL
jgi:hypothetical protein